MEILRHQEDFFLCVDFRDQKEKFLSCSPVASVRVRVPCGVPLLRLIRILRPHLRRSLALALGAFFSEKSGWFQHLWMKACTPVLVHLFYQFFVGRVGCWN